MLDPFPALLTPFPRIFIIKSNANNGRNPPSFLFSNPMTPFPDIAFINDEINGCINEEAIVAIDEAAIGAIIAPRNPPSCFFISCFIVSALLSINRPEFSSDFMIQIISSTSSFEMNKVNPSHALMDPHPLIFFFQIYILKAKLLYLPI